MVETVLRIKIVAPHFVQQTSDALFIQQFFEELIASKMVGVPALNQYIKLSARKTPLQFQGLNEDMEVEVQFAENVSNPKRAPKSWTRTSEWGTYTQEFSWDESNHTARLLRKADMSSARISAKDFTNLLDLVHELRLRVRDQLVIPTP